MAKDNLYEGGALINYQEGDQSLQRTKLVYVPSVDDKFHIVMDEDQLESIAFKYYRSTKLWWLIADINDIFNPFELETGSKLIIPDVNILTRS